MNAVRPKIVLTIILRSSAALILPFDSRQEAQEKVDELWLDYAIDKKEFHRLTKFLREPDTEAAP